MTAVSKGVQNFNKLTKSLLKEATNEGKNITKAQVTEALGKLTADGKVSKADKEAAAALLENAPLTAGAKEALANFVAQGNSNAGGTRPNNALNIRLSGGGESVGRRGGGESGGARGGSESGGVSRPTIRPNRGGGEVSPSRPSRGGGEVSGGGGGSWGGGGGGWSRGGGE
jgi:hypothetical protein